VGFWLKLNLNVWDEVVLVKVRVWEIIFSWIFKFFFKFFYISFILEQFKSLKNNKNQIKMSADTDARPCKVNFD